VPWPVYSERILHHQGAGQWAYEVPEGTRLVITHAVFLLMGVAPAFVQLGVGPVIVVFKNFQATHDQYAVQTKVVAYQGESIVLVVEKAGLHCTISGSLFQDDSGRTGPPLAPALKPIHPERPEIEPL